VIACLPHARLLFPALAQRHSRTGVQVSVSVEGVTVAADASVQPRLLGVDGEAALRSAMVRAMERAAHRLLDGSFEGTARRACDHVAGLSDASTQPSMPAQPTGWSPASGARAWLQADDRGAAADAPRPRTTTVSPAGPVRRSPLQRSIFSGGEGC
jgi:hypothetical protein